ncbi:TetR/AcrR family transcriptional regulator [Geomicrobium sp. JCM 19039]|uniref:TetR/AcrR family transcriptional regulator n=1 Tax=Geomicrobium sp. JCM 19039 TaxID=1460636 RepID=UPI00045F25DA|nr:TetR/AcrR family transcriptional regulator [Geomicrobium sp. JCM 19039]GAK10454.1 transcriptional regulator, TetR family [Geomicrobium sp. JCM 19039]
MITNKRQSIKEAAKHAFSLFGYKGSTVAHVAKVAHVGKGTIYTEFKNKEELFEAVMDDLLADFKDLFDSVLQHDGPTLHTLHKALYGVMQYRKEHKLLAQLTEEVNIYGTHEAVQAIARVEQFILSTLEQAVERGAEKGRLRIADAKITAFTIYKLYMAFIVDWEQKETPLTEQELYDVFRNHIFDGIAIQ